jgi:hypothetical protein
VLEYKAIISQTDYNPQIATRLLNKRNKAWEKSKLSANESLKVNRRAKLDFYNSVNCTMNNYSISAKKKFSILLRLMKNNKFSTIPPLVENDITVQDPLQKSNIFNTFFASKSTVPNFQDQAPHLDRKDGVPSLDSMNTSPIEIVKLIRNIKQAWMS